MLAQVVTTEPTVTVDTAEITLAVVVVVAQKTQVTVTAIQAVTPTVVKAAQEL